MLVEGADMAVVEGTLPVIWAALVVLARRAAESAADTGVAANQPSPECRLFSFRPSR
jgi:hypothetical protein